MTGVEDYNGDYIALTDNKATELNYYSSTKTKIVYSLLLILGITYFTNFHEFPSINKVNNVDGCYYDYLFDIMEKTTIYYYDHRSQRERLMFIAGVLMDFLVYFNIYLWITKASDWIVMQAIILFYLIRQVFLYFCHMRFPSLYDFTAPPIPSLTISYFQTNDFFYSGHIGMPIILFLENKSKMRGPLIMYSCLLVSAVEAYTMLITRGHYTVDMLASIVMSILSYKLVSKHNIDINEILSFEGTSNNKMS